ncbi:Hypp3661 [Branchiostoma lanceolatum]|uniref:Iodothyronine deiodinase n=1 Tax=Branchiostoma lanceolatum TaxID=7740 RepID=A0A8K0A1U2_BRALA|nr:Hypp3661 [Branchiostoma lanceolatum]
MASTYLKRAQGRVEFLVRYVLGAPFYFVLFALVRAAWLFPPLKRQMLLQMEEIFKKVAPGVYKTDEDYQQLFYELTSFASWRGRISAQVLNMEAEVFPGGKATDSSLVRLDGSSCRLLQFARAARPLVISFGSNT